jgi:hypothetical protein
MWIGTVDHHIEKEIFKHRTIDWQASKNDTYKALLLIKSQAQTTQSMDKVGVLAILALVQHIAVMVLCLTSGCY